MEAPIVTPVPEPAPDTFGEEQRLYAVLDTCAENMSTSNLNFGWTAAELWHIKQEEFMEESGGKEKKAIGMFIDHIHQREAKHVPARKTVAEQFRIARFIKRDTYGDIVAASGGKEPTFHQVRAVLFTDGVELDEAKTSQMIDWCVTNDWPPVEDIRIYRDVVSPPATKAPIAERHWKMYVRLAQTIMAETGPEDMHYKVAKLAVDTWSAENPVK